jgi:glutaredoxin 3
MANERRKIEIFSAGCSVCESAVELVKRAACPSCDIQVLDMNAPDARRRAADLGIGSVPAVVIDGKVADCCSGRGVDLAVLRSAGLGQLLA